MPGPGSGRRAETLGSRDAPSADYRKEGVLKEGVLSLMRVSFQRMTMFKSSD